MAKSRAESRKRCGARFGSIPGGGGRGSEVRRDYVILRIERRPKGERSNRRGAVATGNRQVGAWLSFARIDYQRQFPPVLCASRCGTNGNVRYAGSARKPRRAEADRLDRTVPLVSRTRRRNGSPAVSATSHRENSGERGPSHGFWKDFHRRRADWA